MYNSFVKRKSIMTVALLALMGLPTGLSAATIDTDLRYGSKGDQVRILQEFLIAEDLLSGQPTGNFFTLTLQAVKSYQKSMQLPATGFVGPLTRAAINKTPSATTTVPVPGAASTSSTNPDVAAITATIQELLNKINALSSTSTSSIGQIVATSSQSFAFDPKWKDAVVNLFCTDRYGGLEGISSGSGVVIDPRGIILTNAHVALPFLFDTWPETSLKECSVRIGSPASPLYKAAILYMPEVFVTEAVKNAYVAEDNNVYGRGDYALLVIKGPVSSSVSMPASFSYVPVYEGAALPVNTNTYLIGYAASYLSPQLLQNQLYQLASPAMVMFQRLIGTSTKAHVITFEGNVVGQHGSSGGGVFALGGAVAGLMTFFDKDHGYATDQGALNAITSEYILSDFMKNTGMTMTTYLASQDLLTLSKKYMEENGSRYQLMYADLWKSKGFYIPGYYK